MTVNFSAPTGSVNVSFSGQIRALSDSGVLDPQSQSGPVQFSNPANAPVKAYSGQVKAH